MGNNSTEIISTDKAYEVRHWTREFRCTESELFEAMLAVGRKSGDIRVYRAAMPLSRFKGNEPGSHY